MDTDLSGRRSGPGSQPEARVPHSLRTLGSRFVDVPIFRNVLLRRLNVKVFNSKDEHPEQVGKVLCIFRTGRFGQVADLIARLGAGTGDAESHSAGHYNGRH